MKNEGKCEYLEIQIFQHFQSAQLKQLSQWLRVAENSSKGAFFHSFFCSNIHQMSVKPYERLQTQKLLIQRWGQVAGDRLRQPCASNLRPEHFLEVIILFDVWCLLFPPVSILSKRHPTTVMGFATLQLQIENKTLNPLKVDHKSSKLAVWSAVEETKPTLKSLSQPDGVQLKRIFTILFIGMKEPRETAKMSLLHKRQ